MRVGPELVVPDVPVCVGGGVKVGMRVESRTGLGGRLDQVQADDLSRQPPASSEVNCCSRTVIGLVGANDGSAGARLRTLSGYRNTETTHGNCADHKGSSETMHLILALEKHGLDVSLMGKVVLQHIVTVAVAVNVGVAQRWAV